MGKFIAFTFLILGVAFYEMSGGAEFEPELRGPVAVAQTDLAPAENEVFEPEVTRSESVSLIAVSAPVAEPEAEPVAAPVAYAGPLPAGQVVITPAAAVAEPIAAPVEEEVVTEAAAPAADLRSVAGDWVNMRSGPSTDFAVLDTLPRGTEAEVLEVDADGWARIRLMSNGVEGWMAERLLTDS